MRNLRHGLAAVLLAGVALLVGVRAAGLAGHPERPSALGERRWMGWAWRGPAPGRELARAAARLPPGEPVVLVVDPAQAQHAGWWRFVASYHFDRNPVVGVEVGGATLGPGGGLRLAGEPPAGREGWLRVRIGAPSESEVEVEVVDREPGG